MGECFSHSVIAINPCRSSNYLSTRCKGVYEGGGGSFNHELENPFGDPRRNCLLGKFLSLEVARETMTLR